MKLDGTDLVKALGTGAPNLMACTPRIFSDKMMMSANVDNPGTSLGF